jgi:hypothetical protein
VIRTFKLLCVSTLNRRHMFPLIFEGSKLIPLLLDSLCKFLFFFFPHNHNHNPPRATFSPTLRWSYYDYCSLYLSIRINTVLIRSSSADTDLIQFFLISLFTNFSCPTSFNVIMQLNSTPLLRHLSSTE